MLGAALLIRAHKVALVNDWRCANAWLCANAWHLLMLGAARMLRTHKAGLLMLAQRY